MAGNLFNRIRDRRSGRNRDLDGSQNENSVSTSGESTNVNINNRGRAVLQSSLEFLFREYKTLPKGLQYFVYVFILVFTFCFLVPSFMQPTVINGVLRYKRPDGTSVGLFGYKVKSASFSSITDMEGNFTLPIENRIWRLNRATLEIISPPDSLIVLGNVKVGIPFMIEGMVTGTPFYIIEGNAEKKDFVVVGPPVPEVLEEKTDNFDVQLASFNNMFQQETRIRFSRVGISNTDHKNSNAEVYVKVYVNDKEINTPNLPSEKREETWLLLKDNMAVAPNTLFFDVPANRNNVKIELWDRDIFFDDHLASFSFSMDGPQELTLKDTEFNNGSELVLEIRR
ncbi:MAG: hypothetical protein OEX02_06950 [Cyclobacteriaceae bacterium]|nr:hypothetical protein [Cyclobacteriaceae bacterium]